jgi:hypothetical protein
MHDFLLPPSMKVLGFDLIPDEKSNKEGYFKYENNATVHWNKDYNSEFPESKGKVIIYVNMHYSKLPFLGIDQDGGTRHVYHGVCPSKLFLEMLLTSIR